MDTSENSSTSPREDSKRSPSPPTLVKEEPSEEDEGGSEVKRIKLEKEGSNSPILENDTAGMLLQFCFILMNIEKEGLKYASSILF